MRFPEGMSFPNMPRGSSIFCPNTTIFTETSGDERTTPFQSDSDTLYQLLLFFDPSASRAGHPNKYQGIRMSSHIHSSSERSRTNWTTVMERYFVDLMLDQMHRGNRLGHTFNKQAWVDMQVVFNSKFGCQYDKDVLKSHYTSLWKKFNDIKNLLDHNGFSWDDTQQMVVADDHVWDGYIKAHPDAQLYKDKVLMNFNDLCLIYAYTAADGRYSLSSHDIDFDEDIQGTMSIGNGNLTMASHERTKNDWTPTMDNYFIEVMLDELRKGNKIGNAFHKEAWKDMLTKFNENFSSRYGKSFLKNRHKKLFKYYIDVTSLLDQKGFSWDGKQQAIMASNDDWDNYLKAHPDARSYRQKTLLNYSDLCLIYGNATTNGNYSRMPHDQNFNDDRLLITFVGEKGVASFAGPDHRRTCWTAPMDHYLVDLLVDQVLGGNKIGHTLTSQAWIVIVSLFNANFGSCYDRDVLNNRYKHMRRQYNDIKSLLEINGFYWDDTRQMVIAEDYLWGHYVKAHRAAQLYRNTSMPSYHKLCVIYGQESSNGRDSPSACNLDVDSEGPDSMIDGEDIMCHASSGADWTPSMDRYLIDLLLKHAQKGDKIDHDSDDRVWIDIMVSFRERFGLKHDKDVLRSRHKSLGMQYYDMKNLIDRRGFSWDEMQQMVTAYDHVWDAYIEEYPDVKSYRAKTKPNYNDLCLIFGNSTCNEKHNQDFSFGDDGVSLNNGHPKMDWTPPMDRYFIDLMLQQVREGILVDHKVNKLAWADMTMQFNAKFPLEYGRDALKSRFRSLKRLFNNMKILCETGFAWDEMQLRVVADDDIWDAYIKDYPEAQWFRNRSLPNYNDLFLIYGTASTSGRNNASSRYVNAANNVLEVNIGEEEDQILVIDDPMRIHWTKQMERYFIDLMLELVQRGNNFGHRLDEQAWHWMVTMFNEKFGAVCDKVDLENQFLRLMEEYDNITGLLNREGFVWDDTKQLITARDDIWEAYIKGHPDAIRYRGRAVDAYFDLCIIYGNVFPNGRSTSSTGVKPEILDNFNERGFDNVYEDPRERETKAYNQSKKRKQATSVYSRGDLRSNEGGASNSNSRPGSVSTMAVQEESTDFSSIECVVDALQTIPQIDGELFLDACKLLEDEKKAELFVTMDISARRKWLLKKLHS